MAETRAIDLVTGDNEVRRTSTPALPPQHRASDRMEIRMTRNDLDAIQARADAATPGPWFVEHGRIHSGSIQRFDWVAIASMTGSRVWLPDAQFIAQAREDVPALIAEIRELRAGRSHGDNPVQNDPESFAVDNATRVEDPTDDAGYDEGWYCGRGPCSLPGGHRGRCEM